MNVGVFGTGVVGQTIAGKLAELGHAVTMGTRDPAASLARTAAGRSGGEPIAAWLQQHPAVRLGTFEEAAAFGEILFNCTNGRGSLDALAQAGAAALGEKVLIDLANPLKFSGGAPSLFVANTDSLAEQLQRAFPRLKVVKSLNTMNTRVMVNPAFLSEETVVFVSGDDPAARAQVVEILRDWFGWRQIVELGDLSTARGTEMILPLWINLSAVMQTPRFNFRLVR